MFGTFYRSFYIVFTGMFAMLSLSAGGVTLNAAHAGDPASTIVGVGITAVCGRLALRSLAYMRE